MTIQQLKSAIDSLFHITPQNQRLIYLGQLLDEDTKTLQESFFFFFLISSYHIENGSTIQIVPTLQTQQTSSCDSLSLFLIFLALYPPLEERNRLVSSIESPSTNLTSSLSWQRFLTLEGARLPCEGDSLHYPPGTTLESLRQGLLTFNTYVSTLRLPSEYRPHSIDVWSEGTVSVTGTRRFFVGQWVDALDTVSKWLEATVIAVNESYVFIHYNGWPDKWDEWIHAVSLID